MAVRIGINPLTWTNDDMPELGGETPLETCLSEAKQAGYAGIELGTFLDPARDDLDLRLGQAAEELRHLPLELVGVFAVEVQDLLSRLRVQGRVCRRGLVEALHVRKAKFFRDRKHLPFDAGHLAQSELMDLLRRHAGGGAALHQSGIARIAIRQGPQSRLGPPLRGIVLPHVVTEFGVGGIDEIAHRL